MLALLHYFSLRYTAKHPFRVFLSVMAVALGVALYVSMDTSNYSTEEAFQSSAKKLRGNTQLQVVRSETAGIGEDALKIITDTPGIKAAPILQTNCTLPNLKGEGTMMLLGLDFKSERDFRRWDVAEGEAPQIDAMAFLTSNAIIITNTFAARNGLKNGGTFEIDTPSGVTKVKVAAILKDEGPARVFGGGVGVMELHTAQRLFKRQGRLDRIELIVEGDVKAAQAKLEAALGPDYKVGDPPNRNPVLDDAMSRVKALMGISVVAILVAIFIIYNSVSISVVERIKEIGTLRAIGATGGQIFLTVLTEWAIVGLIGSVVGIIGGFSLANFLIRLTSAEINKTISVVVIDEVMLPTRAIIGGFMLGFLTTMAAAAFPARAAMQVSPMSLLRQGLYRVKMAAGYLRQFYIGVASMAFSTLGWFGWWKFGNAGLLSALLGFLGASFVLPQMTLWIAAFTRPILRFYRIEAFMAADNTSKFPQRTALTVIALAGALAMMISAASIVLSFKSRADSWLRNTLPFDLSVNANDFNTTLFSLAEFPEELGAEISALPEIDYTYGIRATFQAYGEKGDKTVMLICPDIVNFDRMHNDRGDRDFVPDEAVGELVAGEACAVSKNFLAIYNLKTGDYIEFKSLHGVKKFKILRAIEDYSWPQGAVFVDRATYKKNWDDSGLSYLDIKFKDGIDKAAAKGKIAAMLKGRYTLFLYEVENLVGFAAKALGDTLKFTNIQVAVAMIIGFLGIVNTLLISVMQRMREIGLLRAVGMTRRQVTWMVVIESVFLAILAGFIGVAIGLMGAKWPLNYHVFQITGYVIPFEMPWAHITFAILASGLIGLVASYIPARRASGVNILDAIGYE